MRKLIILFLLISANCFAQFDLFGDGVNPVNQSNTWIGTQTFDSIYFNVLHSRTGSSNIFTNGTNGRRLNISNTSAEDSMRIQITTLGNGGLIVNEYGAVYVGNAGNADANDSINFKVALNNTYWRFAQGWTSNGQSGDATTGIGTLLPNNADSIIFRGLTGLNTGKYNFIGNLYNNDTLLATRNWVNNNARPYKVYTALLTQTGTSNPTAIVLQNDFSGVTFTWTRDDIGTYFVTASSAVLTADKTAVFITNREGISLASSTVSNTTVANILTGVLNGDSADGALTSTTFEIRVYY